MPSEAAVLRDVIRSGFSVALALAIMQPVHKTHRIEKAHIHHGLLLLTRDDFIAIRSRRTGAIDEHRHVVANAALIVIRQQRAAHARIPQSARIIRCHRIQELRILTDGHLELRDLKFIRHRAIPGLVRRIARITHRDPFAVEGVRIHSADEKQKEPRLHFFSSSGSKLTSSYQPFTTSLLPPPTANCTVSFGASPAWVW